MRYRRWLVGLAMLLCAVATALARPGIPVVLSWDYGVTMPAGSVATQFHVQRCLVAACTSTCAPGDLAGATIPIGQQWGTAVASGTWAADSTRKTVTFTGTTARYVKLVALSEITGQVFASASELDVYADGVVIPHAQMAVVSADSQEYVGENGAAQNVLDDTESTFWHTQWFSAAPAYPHTIILDLGAPVTVTQVDYLPRQDGNPNGTIADYALYLATSLTASYTDSAVEAGSSYVYQIIADGDTLGQSDQSDPSITYCTYVRGHRRGRPDILED